MQTKRLLTPWLFTAGVVLLLVGTWALQHTLKAKPAGNAAAPSQAKR
jgi:hypothetical protein